MAVTPATFTPANVTMLSAMEGTVPVDQGNLIIQDVMANSTMMQLAKYVEMTQQEKIFDVFLGGIGAYWVGEGQRIQTSKPTWTQVTMKAHKVAVIIPVSREYLHYKQRDFFNAMKPLIVEAFYKKFDAATFLNVDNPYTQSIKQSASTAGALITGDLNLVNFDLAVDNLADEGFEANAAVSKTQNNTLLKGMVRDNEGLKTQIYDGMSLDGIPVVKMNKDITEFTKGSLILGDFDQAFYGIPYNISYAISTDATISTITGDDGEPLNLFERELMALRATMDIGFMVVKDEAFAMIEPTVAP